jgi:hypothetical protein
MTIDELSKYYSIKIEVDQIKSNLKELDSTSIGSSKISGMPKGTNEVSNPTENIAIKKLKLEEILKKKQDKLLTEQLKIENFLETIEDSNIRVIIRARFIDGKPWSVIGKELNFERTTPYYHLKKYLKNRGKYND